MPALNHFGLDIGTHSIKAVQLGGHNSRPVFIAAGQVPTPQQTQNKEPTEEDIKAIAETIKKLHHETRISTDKAVTALPESQIFTRVVELPNLSDKEVESAIQWEAEQYVPIPMSEVRLDWQILSRPKSKSTSEKVEVLLVAAPKTLITKYLSIIKAAGLNALSLETEITAVVRSLVQRVEGNPTTMVISIGASTTDLSIVSANRIRFTRSIATGGLALARGVAQELGFEIDQATEYMKTYGLDSTQLEGKVMQSIKPIFDVVVNEIRRALAYYHGKHADAPVKRVVLTGGTAKLPGLILYLAETLGLEVQVGNPWEGISLPSQVSQKLIQESTSYSVSVGLALKST